MLSVVRVNSGQASTYYTADDYYLQNAGTWHGELASHLGFTGKIKEADFQALITGVDPKGRFEIQDGGKENKHTAGLDMTLSASKSVSIAALVLNDPRIADAIQKANDKTMAYYEKHYTYVRHKVGGVVHREYSGNMLSARFQHISSRELDPQFHNHNLVFNFTKNENGDMRAMDYMSPYSEQVFLGQVFQSELAANVKELGYQIEAKSNGTFEIKGMPPELVKEFSQRSEQIQVRYEELKKEFPNENPAKLKEQATIETRKAKDEPSPEEIRKQWDTRFEGLGYNKEELLHNLLNRHEKEIASEINIIIDKAVTIATETEAAPSREDILKAATKLGMGHYRVEQLQTALDHKSGVINLDGKHYTTFEILEMEKGIVKTVNDGKGQYADTLPTEQIAKEIRIYELQKSLQSNEERNLTPGQRQAVAHILGSSDRVIAVQGDAGTGKTTMLDVVRTIADKENKSIVGLSFTGKAASEIEEASQIKSNTVASLIGGKDDLKGKIVVIDETSMLSLRDMKAIIDRCDERSKIVLIGDTKQLQTIGQGKIFSSLQEKSSIQTVRMAETIRQQGSPAYKDVVDTLSNKKIKEAFSKLNSQGSIKQIDDRDKRLQAVATLYLEKPKDTIIVTASNQDRHDLNKIIRHELIANGTVKANESSYITRENKSLMGADRFYGDKYSTGDIVVTNKDGILNQAGSEAKIIAVDKVHHLITVQNPREIHTTTIDLKKHGSHIQVYAEKKQEFATGDKILFLKNDKGLGVKNGQTGYITGINNETQSIRVKMDNGKELQFNPSTQYKYIGHGYALTDYKSQGQTEKHVIYHADTAKGVNFNQAYVGITRGKQSVTIYTDDKDKLGKKMQVEQVKTSTLDFNLANAKTVNQKRLNEIVARTPRADPIINKEVSEMLAIKPDVSKAVAEKQVETQNSIVLEKQKSQSRGFER